jgi:hypothetical protein
MAAGIAVNALGHSDDRWLSALTAQAQQLAHTSNLYHTVPQVASGAGLSYTVGYSVVSIRAPPGHLYMHQCCPAVRAPQIHSCLPACLLYACAG